MSRQSKDVESAQLWSTMQSNASAVSGQVFRSQSVPRATSLSPQSPQPGTAARTSKDRFSFMVRSWDPDPGAGTWSPHTTSSVDLVFVDAADTAFSPQHGQLTTPRFTPASSAHGSEHSSPWISHAPQFSSPWKLSDEGASIGSPMPSMSNSFEGGSPGKPSWAVMAEGDVSQLERPKLKPVVNVTTPEVYSIKPRPIRFKEIKEQPEAEVDRSGARTQGRSELLEKEGHASPAERLTELEQRGLQAKAPAQSITEGGEISAPQQHMQESVPAYQTATASGDTSAVQRDLSTSPGEGFTDVTLQDPGQSQPTLATPSHPPAVQPPPPEAELIPHQSPHYPVVPTRAPARLPPITSPGHTGGLKTPLASPQADVPLTGDNFHATAGDSAARSESLTHSEFRGGHRVSLNGSTLHEGNDLLALAPLSPKGGQGGGLAAVGEALGGVFLNFGRAGPSADKSSHRDRSIHDAGVHARRRDSDGSEVPVSPGRSGDPQLGCAASPEHLQGNASSNGAAEVAVVQRTGRVLNMNHATGFTHEEARLIISVSQQKWGRDPQRIMCPYCGVEAYTANHLEHSALNWGGLSVLCFVGCWLGCCLAPLCFDSAKHVRHQCSSCSHTLGVKRACGGSCAVGTHGSCFCLDAQDPHLEYISRLHEQLAKQPPGEDVGVMPVNL